MATADLQELHSPRLPHNLEAERALLGSMILDNRQIDTVLGVLPVRAVHEALSRQAGRHIPAQSEPLFFSPAHQLIFAAICLLHQSNCGVDLTLLAEDLQRRGQLETAGGAAYLAGLEDDIFSLGQVPQYAQIIGQKWQMRCLIRAARAIAEDATLSDTPAQEILERSEKKIFDIVQEQQQKDFIAINELLPGQMQDIELRAKGVAELPGLATGFRRLDEMTTGLRPANMIIVAARPSMGKTALAMNIAANAAVKLGRPVGIFSLEMSSAELTMRLLCTQAHVTMERVRGNHRLRREELEAIRTAGERLDKAPLYIDDTSSLSILEMRSRGRRLKARCPELALIVIDYLQLMHSGASRVENRQQEVTEISRAIKGLARELNVPIVALSQLSRQSEQRRGTKDKLPRLSDLRESGAIEQDADLVVFIHRERNMTPRQDGRIEPDLATIRVAKQRNGRVGDIELLFLGEYTEFVDVAHEQG